MKLNWLFQKVDLRLPGAAYLRQIGQNELYLFRELSPQHPAFYLSFHSQHTPFYLNWTLSHSQLPFLHLVQYHSPSTISLSHTQTITLAILVLWNCASFIIQRVSELYGVNAHEAGNRDVIIQCPFSLSCKLSTPGEWKMMESSGVCVRVSDKQTKHTPFCFAGKCSQGTQVILHGSGLLCVCVCLDDAIKFFCMSEVIFTLFLWCDACVALFVHCCVCMSVSDVDDFTWQKQSLIEFQSCWLPRFHFTFCQQPLQYTGLSLFPSAYVLSL